MHVRSATAAVIESGNTLYHGIKTMKSLYFYVACTLKKLVVASDSRQVVGSIPNRGN